MAKSDAPNYRKATGSKKCGNCKAWDADATDVPMIGYCKWYDFNCRADHTCDAWAGTNFEKAWQMMKEDGADYGQRPIKESEAMTRNTELPSLKTLGRSQRKISTKRSGGKSPVNIKRVDGAHASSSTRGNSTDFKETQAESNVNAKLRNAGAKGQR